MDRLGATGVDRRVRQHLRLRAEAAGAARRKPSHFDGWFHVAAKELEQARTPPKLPLIASPIHEPEPDDNIYHAHVVQPDNVLPNLVSLHIRHIFTKYGELMPNEQKQPTQTGWREWMMARLSSIMTSLWPR